MNFDQPPETQETSETVETPTEMVSVEEFCTSLSLRDRRVELLAAFHADQVRARTILASVADFNDRFSAFVTKPIA